MDKLTGRRRLGKTTKQVVLEDRLGQPIEEIIRQALRLGKSRRGACRHLLDPVTNRPLSRETFLDWLAQFGIDADEVIAQSVIDSKRSA